MQTQHDVKGGMEKLTACWSTPHRTARPALPTLLTERTRGIRKVEFCLKWKYCFCIENRRYVESLTHVQYQPMSFVSTDSVPPRPQNSNSVHSSHGSYIQALASETTQVLRARVRARHLCTDGRSGDVPAVSRAVPLFWKVFRFLQFVFIWVLHCMGFQCKIFICMITDY